MAGYGQSKSVLARPAQGATMCLVHFCLAPACLVFFLSGCASFTHGYTTRHYQGHLLSVMADTGLQRLGIERAYDETIDAYVSENGLPDYIYVADRKNVQLVYVGKQRVASFHRPSMQVRSVVTVADGLPASLGDSLTPQRAATEADSKAQVSEKPTPGIEPPGEDFSFGSCFAVSPIGHVITSNHVVRGASTIIIKFQGKDPLVAVVTKGDPINDIALLHVDSHTPDYLSFDSANIAHLGERVFTLGFPAPGLLGFEPKYAEGVLSSKSGPQDAPNLMQISMPLQPGNSGGPVINSVGRVIGIVTASAAVENFYEATGSIPQNVNWAVKSEYIIPLLDETPPLLYHDVDAVVRAETAVCLVISRRQEPKP